METAPLTLAHAHARNASAENWKANSSQASGEHQQAAGEFAKAAQGTSDLEAFRVLKLLENHHERLASIIKCNHQSPSAKNPPELSQTTQAVDVHDPSAAAARPTSPRRTPQSPPRATPRRKPPRDLSSSIASNLASARGIPGSQRRPAAPAISAQHVDGRILNRAERATPQDFRKEAPQQARPVAEAEPAEGGDEKENAEHAAKQGPTDEGFKRFFSTFETFYSALSAPLAFAGLPLMTEELQEPASEKPTPKPAAGKASSQNAGAPASAKADTIPDPSTLFSKATLRALDTTPGAAESFIVVPTTGGTVSYAGILNHAGNQTHGGVPSPIIEEEERSFDGEEFVDANEEPAPPSPTTTRSGRRARPGSAGSLAAATEFGKGGTGPGGRKTMEELELENAMMRQLLDKLSKRLHMWEASSQSQSLALAQSFRAHRPPAGSGPSSHPPAVGHAADPSQMEQRLRDLENQVVCLTRDKELLEREQEKVSRENEKLLSVLGRYREKWEVLKAGARGRRERGAAGNGEVGGTGVETGSGAGEAQNAGGTEADRAAG